MDFVVSVTAFPGLDVDWNIRPLPCNTITPVFFFSLLKFNIILPRTHITNSWIVQTHDTSPCFPPNSRGIMECSAHIHYTITLMTPHGHGLVLLHQNEDIHHGN